MKPSLLPMWLAVLAMFATAYGGWKYYQVQQYHQNRNAVSAERLPPLEEFELTKSDGQPFRSQDMHGKVWVTTFFFSTCPGSCKRLNANIKYLSSLDDLEEITWVSISVDPVVDTLDVLSNYSEQMNADPERWLFTRGELDYVKRVGQDFMKMPVSYKGHRDDAVVIDKNGQIAGIYNATSTAETKRMQVKLKELLAEPYTPKQQVSGSEETDKVAL
ncbi:SCO family protein [Adhaeretor mobilis]|uniref:SCO1/SenC n=1 Tax=Adhaeretor mobilis TaxID=1930276 RepID=A0A517MZ58_9BACT|nr:SCO family protein [Adhaeretor mobilis]QDT00176.1 SCO1/SenC [Adhaeretor mobilis]